MRTITIEAEVDVDLNDYFDEFMEELSDDDIVEEVAKRKLEDKFIINKTNSIKMADLNKESTKRFLCDLLEVGYYIDNEQLLNIIKDRI